MAFAAGTPDAEAGAAGIRVAVGEGDDLDAVLHSPAPLLGRAESGHDVRHRRPPQGEFVGLGTDEVAGRPRAAEGGEEDPREEQGRVKAEMVAHRRGPGDAQVPYCQTGIRPPGVPALTPGMASRTVGP